MYGVLNIRSITEQKILNMETLGEKKNSGNVVQLLPQEVGRYEKCAMMQSIKPLS